METFAEQAIICVLGGIFLYAASSKLGRTEPLESTLRALGLPVRLAVLGAEWVPIYEIVLSVAVLAVAPATWGALLAAIASVAITAAGLAAILQNKVIPCSCFSTRSSGVLGMRQLVVGPLLVAATGYLVVASPRADLDGGFARLLIVSLIVASVHVLMTLTTWAALMGYRRAGSSAHSA